MNCLPCPALFFDGYTEKDKSLIVPRYFFYLIDTINIAYILFALAFI